MDETAQTHERGRYTYIEILPWYYYGETMGSINVKISAPMEARINDFLETHPYYMNKSEMIRDAIRHLIEDERRLSVETLKVIEEGKKQVERGVGKTLEEVEKGLNA